MKKGHVIKAVEPGSIGDELGLEPGDRLISINGNLLEDIFDYEYYMESESLTALVEKADGEEWELDIENQYQDLGLTFENGLMSEYRSCRNKCIFCFIDQMPKGMRETLYFKDDDSRLSFLQGNYVTLTNMSEKDIDRIIRFKLSPINISVHTTNPQLRCRMLNNRFAGRALAAMDRLYEAGTPMNGQIVMCRDINDREELDRTIGDLARSDPGMLKAHMKKQGEALWQYAWGREPDDLFGIHTENKGYGNSVTTATDVTEEAYARQILLSLCETVGIRLRADHRKAGAVSVGMRTGNFENSSRQMQLDSATDVTEELYQAACTLLMRMWDGHRPLRLLNVTATRLTEEEYRQYSLFDRVNYEKLEKANRAMDSIRSRFGEDAVMRASFLKSTVSPTGGGLNREKRREQISRKNRPAEEEKGKEKSEDG